MNAGSNTPLVLVDGVMTTNLAVIPDSKGKA